MWEERSQFDGTLDRVQRQVERRDNVTMGVLFNTICDPSFDHIWGGFKTAEMLQEPCNILNHDPAWFAPFHMVNNAEFKSVYCKHTFDSKSWSWISPELVKMLYITARCKQLIISCHPLLMQPCATKKNTRRVLQTSQFSMSNEGHGKKLFYTEHAARWSQFHRCGYYNSIEAYGTWLRTTLCNPGDQNWAKLKMKRHCDVLA